MITRVHRSLILALFALLSWHGHAHVNVLYPVGGETFIQGNSVVIQWEIAQPHDLIDWDVHYSIDGGETWIPLGIDMPPYILSYEWEVPFVETSLGQVKVYMNNTGDDYIDYSDNFNIVPNTSPPYVDIGAQNIVIPCNSSNQQAAIQAWLNNHGDAAIINYCGNLVWTHDYTGLSNDCGATGISFVTFTATDQCGSTETTAQLSVTDLTAPAITTPAVNLSVETDGHGNLAQRNAWLNSNGGATATDACGSVGWSNNYTTITPVCGQAGNAVVVFSATDACGNINTTSATFTITDEVNPTLLQPASNLSIAAGPNSGTQLQAWLNNHGGANASDLGGTVTWEHNFTSLTAACGNTGSASVTFTASDPCGNSVQTTATVEITDTTAPTINTTATHHQLYCGVPDYETILQAWLENHGGATATDEGSAITWQHNFSSLSDACGISGFATVLFTASDACGNASTTSATFQLTDVVPPLLEAVALDTIVHCTNNNIPALLQSWLNRHGGARAVDECGAVTWTNNFSGVVDACELETTYTIIFEAKDECLNSRLTVASFTTIDTAAITSTVSLAELPFSVFPNPADDVITVAVDQYPVAITLYDAFGRRVYNIVSTAQQTRIPVDQLTAGVYLVTCETSRQRGIRVVALQ